jgi:hypothetical protein
MKMIIYAIIICLSFQSLTEAQVTTVNYASSKAGHNLHILGYSYTIEMSNHPVIFSLDFPVGLELNNRQLSLTNAGISPGIQMPVIEIENWKVAGAAALPAYLNRFNGLTGYSASIYGSLVGGYFTSKWFVGGEGGITIPFYSIVRFYEMEQIDGDDETWKKGDKIWFAPRPGLLLQSGIQSGINITDWSGLALRFGIYYATRDKRYIRHTFSNFYVDLQLNIQLNRN